MTRGPGFAPARFPVAFAGQEQPFVRAVTAATTVQVAMLPATPRERWVGAMLLRLRDARGEAVVEEMTQIDGSPEFVWSIGLAPGTYSRNVRDFDGGAAATTFTVAASPLRVELQLTH